MDDDLATLANNALMRIGEAPISIESESVLAETVVALTPGIVDAALTMQMWRFATFQFALTRDDAQAERLGYSHAFRHPGGRLAGPLLVTSGANSAVAIRDYATLNDHLFVNSETVTALYLMRPPVTQWPPLFREAVLLQLCEHFCLAIVQKADMAARFREMAYGLPSERGKGGAWGRWVMMAAQEGGQKVPIGNNDWITAGRFEGSRYGGHR
jgi:hypothetical protein